MMHLKQVAADAICPAANCVYHTSCGEKIGLHKRDDFEQGLDFHPEQLCSDCSDKGGDVYMLILFLI